MIQEMRTWTTEILKALCFEAICCSKSSQFTANISTYVTADVVAIELLVDSFKETQSFEDLEELYKLIYNIQDKVIQYKPIISQIFVNHLGNLNFGHQYSWAGVQINEKKNQKPR